MPRSRFSLQAVNAGRTLTHSWLWSMLGVCRFQPPPNDYLVPTTIRASKEKAMKYLCLVYFEPKAWEALSGDEHAALDRNSIAYDEELRGSGHYIVSNALQPVRTAKTVRVRMGKLSTIDGPFAETREHLGGFILIDAKDMNEAVELASKIPLAKLGS